MIALEGVTTFLKGLFGLSSCQTADARVHKLESLYSVRYAGVLTAFKGFLLFPVPLLHLLARLHKNGVSDPAKNQENRNSENHAASGADHQCCGLVHAPRMAAISAVKQERQDIANH